MSEIWSGLEDTPIKSFRYCPYCTSLYCVIGVKYTVLNVLSTSVSVISTLITFIDYINEIELWERKIEKIYIYAVPYCKL